jgi:holo-[acyl-carrier protein] synthase
MQGILRAGVDLIEIERVRSAISRHGAHFLERIYTAGELADCRENISSLAARFAAKEAVAKALRTGIGQVSWREIEIRHGQSGEPILFLHGAALEKANVENISVWSISMSHSHQFAIAMVVMSGLSQ